MLKSAGTSTKGETRAVNTFLSPNQEALQEQYGTFANEVVAPVAADLASHKACLREFLQSLGQKGYMGISVPREYGGQGQSFLASVLFVEALGEHEAGLGLTLASHQAVIEVLKKFGTDTQKSRYLPLLARGEVLGTLAFTEEQAGTDVFAVRTEATASGDGFDLEGQKVYVVNGEIAGLHLVLAKAEGGLGLFLVDTADNSSVKAGLNRSRMGLKSARANDVKYNATKVSRESQLAQSKNAEAVTSFANDVAKVVISAAAIGLLRSCLKLSVEHARKREQFGTNIGQFQGIQWKLADMLTESAGAELQVHRAAWALEEESEKFATYAAMSKLLASKVAKVQTGEAIQVLGAAGLSEDLPLERFYRDAKAMEICLGTSEAQKIQLVTELRI